MAIGRYARESSGDEHQVSADEAEVMADVPEAGTDEH